MAESEFHYALAVRSKRLDIPDMSRGKWVLMYVGKDFNECNRRYKLAQPFLRPLAGEMVVFKIDANNIGTVRVIGLFGTHRAPWLDDVVRGDTGVQKAFWRRAGVETGFISSGTLPFRPAPQKKKGWLSWLSPA